MGLGGTKHIYHEDTQSKEMAAAAAAAAEAANTMAAQAQEALRRQEEATQAMMERFHQEQKEAEKQSAERQAAYNRHIEEMKKRYDAAAEAAAKQLQEQQKARAEAAEQARRQALADAQRLRDEQAQRAAAAAAHARELEEQRVQAEQRLEQELQAERARVHQERLKKWIALNRDYPVPEYLKGFVTEVLENIEATATQQRYINVGFLGDSGVGKSSLIKALLEFLGCLDPNHVPKPCVEGDGTRHPERYQLVDANGRFGGAIVSVWDLPGQGTAAFPSQTYLRNMGLKHFDAVVIATDGRWSEGDASLYQAIKFAGNRYCVARTKMDRAVKDGFRDHKLSVAEVMDQCRKKLMEQLRETNTDRLHLVTTRPTDYCKIDGICEHIMQLVSEELADKVGHRNQKDEMDVDAPNDQDLMDVDIGVQA